MSTIFFWRIEDFQYLLDSCDFDPLTPYILKHFSQKGRLLEAGCGSGRYVKYLHDRGYNIIGIEYNQETVTNVNRIWPELTVTQGDILSIPYEDGWFPGIISIGVVEHSYAFMRRDKRDLTEYTYYTRFGKKKFS